MRNGDDGYYNHNIHSNTLQEHYIPSRIYLPLEDEAVFCDFFQQQQFLLNDHHEIMTNNVQSSIGESCNMNEHLVSKTPIVEPNNNSPKKRSSNRSDRHSKINTARGPRDRRMRLSLDVAKKLFGLQDLLGFDKASETVDWLLTESKTAIQDLLHDRDCSFMGASNSASSTSDCEVVSGSTGGQFMVKTIDDQETTKSCGIHKKQKDKSTRVRKCADFVRPLAKETRVKARQRAKERTIEKQNNYKHGVGQDSTFKACIDQVMDQGVNQIGSWSTFHESEHQIVDQLDQMSSNFGFNQGFFGDNSSLLMNGNCSPFYYFDYQHSSGLIDGHEFNCVQTNEKAFEGNNI